MGGAQEIESEIIVSVVDMRQSVGSHALFLILFKVSLHQKDGML